MTSTMKNVKLLAIAIAVLCAIAFMPLLSDSMQSHAATNLSVSVTNATIGVGNSVTVKVTGLKSSQAKKVTWSSSAKSIAKVSKTKGATVKISGVAPGSAKITAKYGSKKVTVSVKVTTPTEVEVVKEVIKEVPTTPSKEELNRIVKEVIESLHIETVDLNRNTSVNQDNYLKNEDISVTGYYQGDATVYSLLYQESAEVAALQMQAFNLAKIRADEAIAANGGTGEGLAIVTDIDSTIADDTCYIAGAVLDAEARIALGLDPWNNDDWDGYYQAVATDADTVIPGAKEFLDYTYEQGIEWYYITNRPYYELDLTVQQLYTQGFLEKAPDKDGNNVPDLVDAFSVLREDPDGDGPFKTYQDYYYYGDEELGALDDDGWCNIYDNAAYTKALNATGKVEMTPQSFSVANDYRVQVQGTDFDSDKGWRRANVAKTVGGYENIIMYLGDSINDMVSDYETKYPEIWGGTDRWDGHGADFTRSKQFNDTRTANASKDYWKDKWGKEFIVLPNATYGDWYKTTWAKGKLDSTTGINSKTVEGQQTYIYNQIWAHSYKNEELFHTWYEGPSPTGPEIQ